MISWLNVFIIMINFVYKDLSLVIYKCEQQCERNIHLYILVSWFNPLFCPTLGWWFEVVPRTNQRHHLVGG